MKGSKSPKRIEKEFKKIVKDKFISPSRCTQLHQTRAYIFELNKIIKDYEQRFDYVPPAAQVLFNDYNMRQEKMLYDDYLREYSNE
jgi:hypothetical protein